MTSSIFAASVARLVIPCRRSYWSGVGSLMFGCSLVAISVTAHAQTALADQPIFSNLNISGNLSLPLSVEWPTVQRAAHTDAVYASGNEYLGYFDPAKCYQYSHIATETALLKSHFYPTALAAVDGSGNTLRTCTGAWSGNFLNWAATQTIDPFRWALTGGYRVVDEPTYTILEKARSSADGNLYPDKSVTNATTLISATPLNLSSLTIRIDHLGNKMRFTQSGSIGATGVPPASPFDGGKVYEVYVRVKVCEPSFLEANCVRYGSNWKPQGLLQTYANKLRFSVFGYLNDSSFLRDGGVLRARQKFVGPTQPVPGSGAVINAPGATPGQTTGGEWSASTGQFVGNPDTDDATATNTAFSPDVSVVNSGVMNYINKFGQLSTGNYKSYDPVSELYYATLRYLKNLGNVASYTDMTGASPSTRTTWIDGFPVITNWTDPIQYSCQRNFILGIGDIYTHRDKNLPGSTSTVDEPGMPSAVSGDPSYTYGTGGKNAVTATNKVFSLQGLSNPNTDNYSGRNNSAGIAGLAYDANTRDIRTDYPGMRVQTYWVDVLEQPFVANNQFYLAAKYGGLNVPAPVSPALPFNPYTAVASDIQNSWWHTPSGGPTDTNLVGAQLRPDNYFTGGRPDQLVAGLNAAFADIASRVSSYTTSFSTSLPQVATAGNASFSSQFDANTWTGELTANILSFDSTGVPITPLLEAWKFTDKLATQVSGTGWDTARRVVSWDGTAGGGGGVAFRSAGTSKLTTADLATLDTSYVAGVDSIDYLDYLRGDRSHELGCSASCGTTIRVYRSRVKLVGDIVGSKASPVGGPSFPYSDATNPGYSAFKALRANRRTIVYVGSNDGMMHAINGALVTTPTAQPAAPAPAIPVLEYDAAAGNEMFAYVPRALYKNPDSSTNSVGLVNLGNPSFTHRYMVNATPKVYDIDFGRTPGGTGTDWRSVLIGGMGKGGRSYYAMDVTDPSSWTSENAVAAKVLWEFSDSAMGYTYGEPVVAKTKKYGWVVIFLSGYNNVDGFGYFIFVNPRTGEFLERVKTSTASPGLAHSNAFIVDASDGTADSIYSGDLLGNLWRVDLTGTPTVYPPAFKIATLTDASDNPQPVTSRPSIEVHPGTKKRFIMVGTGRLLDASDIVSTQRQTFYAITDGTNAQFNSTLTAPLAFPVMRTQLANNTNALSANLVPFDPSTKMGWYEDLGTAASGDVEWRVTTDSTTLLGSVAFAASLPTIADACNPTGSSRIYARDYATEKSTVKTLVSNVLTSSLYAEVAGSVTDLRFLSVGGKPALIAGTDTGGLSKIETAPPPPVLLRRLNWRELQRVD